jgi:hypothetical protein
MKYTALTVIALMLICSQCFAQNYTITGNRDSVGTATTYFQKINLGTAALHPVHFINDGSVNLYSALNPADTLYTIKLQTIKPGEIYNVDINTQYVWIKGVASCAYRVGVGHITGSSTVSISGTPNVAIVTEPDTTYGWHIWVGIDSLTRATNYTAYAAGQALNDSTGQGNTAISPKVLVFTLPSRYAGWEGQITDVYENDDSTNAKTHRLTFYNDSTNIPRAADGVLIPYKASNITRRLGFIDIAVSGSNSAGCGTGESNYSPPITFDALPTNKIYAIVEQLAATTPQKNEHCYFKIKVWVRKPLP